MDSEEARAGTQAGVGRSVPRFAVTLPRRPRTALSCYLQRAPCRRKASSSVTRPTAPPPNPQPREAAGEDVALAPPDPPTESPLPLLLLLVAVPSAGDASAASVEATAWGAERSARL